MNWLQKLAALEAEWWRHGQYHMTKVLEMMFDPLPPKAWPYAGSEILYLPNIYSKTPPVGVESFEFELRFRFTAYRKLKLYECFAELTFDRKMEAFLTYDRKNKYIYRTDRVQGLENIDANLLRVACFVQANSLEDKNDRKIMGPKELRGEEMVPYYIMQTIEAMILSDFDSGPDQDIEEPIPGDDSSVPFTPSEDFSPSLVGS